MIAALKDFSIDGLTEDQRLRNQESLWKREIRPSGFNVHEYATQMRIDNLRRNNGIGMIGYQFDVTLEALKNTAIPAKPWLGKIEKEMDRGFLLASDSGMGRTLILLAVLNHFRSPTCRVMYSSGAAFDGDFKFNSVNLLNAPYLAIDDVSDIRHEPFSAKLFSQLYTVLAHREAKGLVTFIGIDNKAFINSESEKFVNRISRVGEKIEIKKG